MYLALANYCWSSTSIVFLTITIAIIQWRVTGGTWPAGISTYGSGCRADVGDCKDLRRPGFLSSQKRTVRFNRFWDQSTRPNEHASCRSRYLPIKFVPPPGFIQAFPRGSRLNGCKECLEQSPTRSPSRSQVSRHDELEWGCMDHLFRRPLGRGCYTDRMIDRQAPTTTKPKSLHWFLTWTLVPPWLVKTWLK